MSLCLPTEREWRVNLAISDATHLFVQLLHPRRAARNLLELGSAVAPRSAPGELFSLAPRGEQLDVVILSPTPSEWRSSQWINDAVSLLSDHLSVEGVVYLVAPEGARWRFVRPLEERGFQPRGSFIHLEYGQSLEYVVRCESPALALAASMLPLHSARKCLLRMAALGIPLPSAAFGATTPRSAVAFQHAGAPPPFSWLIAEGSDHSMQQAAVTRLKKRGQSATAAIWPWRNGQCTSERLIKIALTESAIPLVERELRSVRLVGGSAAAAGAAVPKPLHVSKDSVTVHYAYLDGTPADALLASGAVKRDDVLQRLTRWLTSWSALTKRKVPSAPMWAAEHVLMPARSLGSILDEPSQYFEWLGRACTRVVSRPLLTVASHGDLTMSNVLIEERQPLRVVDWESARTDGLPLEDLYYAAADAHAATTRYRDRVRSLIEAFDQDSPYGKFVTTLARRVEPDLGGDIDLSQLLLHATALKHAVNEQAKNRPGTQPFATLVRWMAARVGRAGEGR
jgi:hypothetical protein